MAIRIAAPGGGNWTAGGTWVGGVAPTSADDAQLTAASGNVTIDAGAVGRSLDCTTYTGTLTHTAGVTLTLGDATPGLSSVALKLVAGMTYTLGSVTTSAISFVSTSATQQTITTGGRSLGNWTINGAGSSYLLGDANTIGATATMTLSAGTFNTGNFACSWGLFVISGAGTKTLTLGSSAITITAANGVLSDDLAICTHTATTAVATFNGGGSSVISGANWNGLSLVITSASTAVSFFGTPVFNNVTVNGFAGKTSAMSVVSLTVTGTLTVTGNSTVNRILMQSDATGTSRTVTTAAVSFSNVDFRDITAAGAAGTWTGTSMGNALGNSNITFDTPATQTRSGAGGNWSTAGNWTSRVPLPQDNVIVNASATGTIFPDMPRMGADITFTGFAGTADFSFVAAAAIYGSITLGSGMTVSGTGEILPSARSAKSITSNGKTFSQSVRIINPGGTYTLQDDFATASGHFLACGVDVNNAAVNNCGLDTNSKNLTVGGIVDCRGTGSTVTLGTSTITLTQSSGTVWSIAAAVTFSGASSTIIISGASASGRSFGGPGVNTYGTLTYTTAGSTGSLTIFGTNTFATINFSDASNARSLLFIAATTTTVTNFNVVGTAGKLMTVDSATAATHTLTKPTGVVSTDFLNVAHSIATGGAGWYAGANSTDGGNNTGWVFHAPPTGDFWFGA